MTWQKQFNGIFHRLQGVLMNSSCGMNTCSEITWTWLVTGWFHWYMDFWIKAVRFPWIQDPLLTLEISIFGQTLFITLIARRSKEFAGARFLKRGVNDQVFGGLTVQLKGHVANEVESEQIVSIENHAWIGSKDHKLHLGDHYTSFVQHRGSIPLSWTQEATNMTPKPPIQCNFCNADGFNIE